MPTKSAKRRPRKAAKAARSSKSAARRPKRHEPQSLRLRHITPGITVNDLARSLAFYTEGLGFIIEERWEEEGKLAGVGLKAGAAELVLTQDDFKKGRDRVKGVGVRLWFYSTQDLDGLAARAKSSGIVLDQEPADMPWGARVFMLTDPDGFKISFTKES
ncbi:MAG TPA: VOC family protein [Candidatus Dormibacteraeota bacterium]|nr:VOC family protein [Candidatus Dormibacteraeota bacterium]